RNAAERPTRAGTDDHPRAEKRSAGHGGKIVLVVKVKQSAAKDVFIRGISFAGQQHAGSEMNQLDLQSQFLFQDSGTGGAKPYVDGLAGPEHDLQKADGVNRSAGTRYGEDIGGSHALS